MRQFDLRHIRSSETITLKHLFQGTLNMLKGKRKDSSLSLLRIH